MMRDGYSSPSARLRDQRRSMTCIGDRFIGAITFHHESFDRTWALITDDAGRVMMIGNQLLGWRILKGETVLDLLADAIRQDRDAA